MSDPLSTPQDVIAAFGGPSKLARRLGCRPSAVSNWNQEGIPKSRWPDLLDFAEQDGIAGFTMAALRRIAESHQQRGTRPP